MFFKDKHPMVEDFITHKKTVILRRPLMNMILNIMAMQPNSRRIQGNSSIKKWVFGKIWVTNWVKNVVHIKGACISTIARMINVVDCHKELVSQALPLLLARYIFVRVIMDFLSKP